MIVILTLLLILVFPALSWSALAVANSEECHSEGAGGAVSCTTNAVATTTGSLFVCNAGYYGEFDSVTDSTGNVYVDAVAQIQQSDADFAFLRQVYKENGTGNAAHTFTLTLTGANFPVLVCLEITGAATVGALDQSISAADAASTSHNSGATGVTIQNDEILVAGASTSWPTTFISDGVFTTDENVPTDWDTEGVFTEHRIVSSMGAYSYTFQTEFSRPTIMVLATYKQAAGGGGTAVVPTQVRVFE